MKDELELDRLIKRSVGRKHMGVSSTTAWRRERDDPDFPKPIQTGPGSFCYRLADVRRWIETRPTKTGTAKA